MSTGKRDTRIPRRPLLWLATALLFTVPPMFAVLSPWVPALLLISIVAKFWMEPRGYRLRFAALKLLLSGVALAVVFFTYGAVRGIEPGISLVIVLMSMKILEAHTAREFHFMVMLGWVLCLCGFFLAQDFAIAICLVMAFTLLVAALVQFHRGSAARVVWPPLRAACLLLAQATPLIVLLFLLFPRVTAGLRITLGPTGASAAGFSNRLSPGGVAVLANSSAIAFRAEFPDGNVPAPDTLYWRGLVMGQGDGMEWRAPDFPAAIPGSRQHPRSARAIRQLITMEPHGARWMFALDWPAEAPPGSSLAPGDYLLSAQNVIKARRYEVMSVPQIAGKELQARERKLMLSVPESIAPAVRRLAESWAIPNSDSRAIVRRALEYFQTQGFRYSLSPGEYKKNDLEEFLFRRRVGFCEHYAASFATLMRIAGVPARVVVGYLGGEFNPIGRFFLVRQSDTHAWCEVWLPEAGWTRVDPTSVVAPERVRLGFDSFLERSTTVGNGIRPYALSRTLARQPVLANIRLAWESLNYAWDTRVLSFDAEAQQDLVANVGLSGATPMSLLACSATVVALVVASIALWMRLRARPSGDELMRLYEQFCRTAARLGAKREPIEGPVDFSRRAARLLPQHSERIARISKYYVQLRYAPSAGPVVVPLLAREINLFGAGLRVRHRVLARAALRAGKYSAQ